MKWEYNVVKLPTPDEFLPSRSFRDQFSDLPEQQTDLLNALGAEGWEWFHAEPYGLFYFRRPVEEERSCCQSGGSLLRFAQRIRDETITSVPERPNPNVTSG